MTTSLPRIAGCLPVLATPFGQDEEVDVDALRRIVRLNVDAGVDGLVCFGLASEAAKLTDAERATILEAVIDEVAGAAPVIAGCDHPATSVAASRCRSAAKAGAAAVMLAPPSPGSPDDSDTFRHYMSCSSASDLPLIVQDAPSWTGVQLSIDLLARIAQACDTVQYIKLEAPPIGDKARAVSAVGLAPLAGYGAVHLAEDLDVDDVVGFMPGCALPEIYVAIWRARLSGDRADLHRRYASLLPLLTFQMTSLDSFIDAQKWLLARRGTVPASAVRAPLTQLGPSRVAYLARMLESMERHEGWPASAGLESA